MIGPYRIEASIDTDTVEGSTRYRFSLFGAEGDVARTFIVDVPDDPNESTDVWVDEHTAWIGDTPDDGFATFTPKD
jgi:hypothetical protein